MYCDQFQARKKNTPHNAQMYTNNFKTMKYYGPMYFYVTNFIILLVSPKRPTVPSTIQPSLTLCTLVPNSTRRGPEAAAQAAGFFGTAGAFFAAASVCRGRTRVNLQGGWMPARHTTRAGCIPLGHRTHTARYYRIPARYLSFHQTPRPMGDGSY